MASISNSDSGKALVGTASDDSIYNRGDDVTIAGGAGNDTLDN